MDLCPTLENLTLCPNHSLAVKRTIKTKACYICNGRIKVAAPRAQCINCSVYSHLKCSEKLKQIPCAPSENSPIFKQGKLFVPYILQQCVNAIEKRAVRGLYSLPMSNFQNSRKIYNRLLQGKMVNLKSCSIHDITACLEKYLQDYPIIPSWHVQTLVKLHLNPMDCFRAIMEMPKICRHTLSFIILHFIWLTEDCTSRMDKQTLLQIFAPILIGGNYQHIILESLMSIPKQNWIRSFHFSSLRKMGYEQKSRIYPDISNM